MGEYIDGEWVDQTGDANFDGEYRAVRDGKTGYVSREGHFVPDPDKSDWYDLPAEDGEDFFEENLRQGENSFKSAYEAEKAHRQTDGQFVVAAAAGTAAGIFAATGGSFKETFKIIGCLTGILLIIASQVVAVAFLYSVAFNMPDDSVAAKVISVGVFVFIVLGWIGIVALIRKIMGRPSLIKMLRRSEEDRNVVDTASFKRVDTRLPLVIACACLMILIALGAIIFLVFTK